MTASQIAGASVDARQGDQYSRCLSTCNCCKDKSPGLQEQAMASPSLGSNFETLTGHPAHAGLEIK
ncbi:hypothetical protein SCLCIDRAFT_690924 [Scleroderma citrinum Foug A]|uniref:Uncharacterized protein n=1 Tax=Scleroderma citrinum Foug A TaxID=1036808 RepID=A0A0C3E728_9AGAM|nr:hypothetical protein SCLCIDRAFT_690924 [Scleroderma citrinum Foug A]